MALGKAVVNILANLKPLKRGLMNAQTAVKAMVKSIARGSFKILRAGLTKIAQAAKLAAAAILGIGIASIKVAADAQETENLFVESMGEMGEAARKWAREYSRSMGLYETDTKKMLGTLNVMLSSMGLGTEEAFKMSKQLTELANDMASFYNLKPEEAFQKIQAGITGEIEPLKRLGILVNESTIQARVAAEKSAKSNMKWLAGVGWIAKETKRATITLTEQEKVMLRYQAILDQTQKAQGDMGRTLNSTTNVFRAIRAQLMTTAENIGKVFIPMVTKVSISVREWLKNNQEQIILWAEVIREKINLVIGIASKLIEMGTAGNWKGVLDAVVAVVKNIYAWARDQLIKLKPVAEAIGESVGKGIRAGLTKISQKKKDVAVGGGLIAGGAVVGGSVGGPVGAGIGAGVGAIGAAGRVNARHIQDITQAVKDLIWATKENTRIARQLNEE